MEEITSIVSKINFCSREQLEKFIGKICIWNLSFMERPLTGRLIEVNKDYFLIEMRDGRTLVASINSVVGFGMAKHQPQQAEVI
jgi:hypothetical protein